METDEERRRFKWVVILTSITELICHHKRLFSYLPLCIQKEFLGTERAEYFSPMVFKLVCAFILMSQTH